MENEETQETIEPEKTPEKVEDAETLVADKLDKESEDEDQGKDKDADLNVED